MPATRGPEYVRPGQATNMRKSGAQHPRRGMCHWMLLREGLFEEQTRHLRAGYEMCRGGRVNLPTNARTHHRTGSNVNGGSAKTHHRTDSDNPNEKAASHPKSTMP
jgi:hypothetical protein